MTTQTNAHARLQSCLQRFDALAEVVGPLNPAQNPTVKEVQGLLSLCAEQCGIAAAILDMADTVGEHLPTEQTQRPQRFSPAHREGRMVVVPGFGQEDFQFPDINQLVNGALSRIGGGGSQRRDLAPKVKREPVEQDPLAFVLGVTHIDDIARVPPEDVVPISYGQPKTPNRDLLKGGNSDPQVCFLRDAERLVEQTTYDADGIKVVEFFVNSNGDLPTALLTAADVFLINAEKIISAAERLWPSHQPPATTAAQLPEEEPRFVSYAGRTDSGR